MIVALLAAFAMPLFAAPSRGLPQDPFERTATRALRGDFGNLQEWQAHAYRLGLLQDAVATQRFIATQYNAGEPDGRTDRRGAPCTLRHCAVSVRRAPSLHGGLGGHYVWTEAGGIRQVLDCGSTANERSGAFRAALRSAGWGSAIWIDLWFASARDARAAGVNGWEPIKGAVIYE